MVQSLSAHPDIAAVLLLAGLFAIYLEFLRPGSVLPCVVGSVVALTAFAALLKNPAVSPEVAFAAFACWLSATVYLLRMAIRARRNKMGE